MNAEVIWLSGIRIGRSESLAVFADEDVRLPIGGALSAVAIRYFSSRLAKLFRLYIITVTVYIYR
jgi:hypothetical protein